jgi:enoyl-CoA hydratase/carnithine racemase
MFSTLLYCVESSVATITLHRPDKLNAFTAQMASELVQAVDRVDADDAVRAVVVTGEGRAFCAGADLAQRAATFRVGGEGGLPRGTDGGVDYSDAAARDTGGIVSLRLFNCKKPLIAAINGPAVGVGATMTLPMDVRLASDTARFGFVFARRGIVPEAASSYFLPRVVGISRALEWCYTGRIFPAAEALAGGLIKAIYKRDELLPAAYSLAHEIADNAAPVSVALTRQMMWRGLTMQHPMEAHKIDSRGIVARGRSADAAEGVLSFFEKRLPVFADKVSSDMPDFFPWWDEPKYE